MAEWIIKITMSWSQKKNKSWSNWFFSLTNIYKKRTPWKVQEEVSLYRQGPTWLGKKANTSKLSPQVSKIYNKNTIHSWENKSLCREIETTNFELSNTKVIQIRRLVISSNPCKPVPGNLQGKICEELALIRQQTKGNAKMD